MSRIKLEERNNMIDKDDEGEDFSNEKQLNIVAIIMQQWYADNKEKFRSRENEWAKKRS